MFIFHLCTSLRLPLHMTEIETTYLGFLFEEWEDFPLLRIFGCYYFSCLNIAASCFISGFVGLFIPKCPVVQITSFRSDLRWQMHTIIQNNLTYLFSETLISASPWVLGFVLPSVLFSESALSFSFSQTTSVTEPQKVHC